MNEILAEPIKIQAREERQRHLEKMHQIEQTNLKVSVSTAILFAIAFLVSMILL